MELFFSSLRFDIFSLEESLSNFTPLITVLLKKRRNVRSQDQTLRLKFICSVMQAKNSASYSAASSSTTISGSSFGLRSSICIEVRQFS